MRNAALYAMALCMFNASTFSQLAAGSNGCYGILRQEKGDLEIERGEDICVIREHDYVKVMKTCFIGRYCRIRGVVGPCVDSGECIEFKSILRVQKK